jgi:hypothetical protein
LVIPKEDPIAADLLKRDKEFLAAFHRLVMKLVPSVEFALERELSYELLMVTPLTPERRVRLRGNPLAEVQHAKVL